MSSHAAAPSSGEKPLILGDHTFDTLTTSVLEPVLKPGKAAGWLAAFAITGSLVLMLLGSVAWLLLRGVGVWGINIPVAWGMAIVNFVWWIGIGHAGTLISAILFLLRQEWRNSINRFAEAMTLFAVANAGLFPLLHLGRIWRFYYLFPYYDTMGVWPQWRSPLVWDVIAVTTYATVSLLFWYVGLLPDLAALRDSARTRFGARLAGFFSLGWRGDARHWQRHQMLYLLMAGLATPLVVSVHSIVSLDFAVSIVPGWHTTIFPPYFVAGAIYSGFAMVVTVAVPLRAMFKLHDFVTLRHFDTMGKVMLASGLVLAYGYLLETFTALMSPERYEHFLVFNRALGPYWSAYWTTLICNLLIGQLLWFRWIRVSPVAFVVVSLFVNLGMWLERYVIVIVSLHHDYLPSSWDIYIPTFWDWSLFIGSLGFFSLLMLLFARFVPMIAIYELRETLHRQSRKDAPAASAAADAARNVDDGQPQEPDAAYGWAAEFDSPEQLAGAARAAHAAGVRDVEYFSPLPVHGLPRAPHSRPLGVTLGVFIGGLASASAAYFMQWYAAAIDYPINVAGRPLNSWPSFIPLTFELGVLGGTLTGLVTMLIGNRLPRLHHPLFETPEFERASRDRFFLCVRNRRQTRLDPEIRDLLRDQGAQAIRPVPE